VKIIKAVIETWRRLSIGGFPIGIVSLGAYSSICWR